MSQPGSQSGSQTIRLAPSWSDLVPWTDRRGRLSPIRAVTFGLLLVPGILLAGNWMLGNLGARPVTAAIHSTGYWTIWILLASLAVTPLKALTGTPNVVVIRRMIGNAALIYAAIHLTLYATDQNWRLWTIASEILKRFYLTIGFAALLGLAVLGFTSTDGWIRSLGKTWKRLHRIVYGLTVLGLVHYMLQSKLDVSQSLLAMGVFTWLMLWRTLPAGRDREWLPLIGISVAAGLLTLAYEYTWYRFGTRIDPLKVVIGEGDIAYGLHPAGQTMALGLLATALTALRRVSMTPLGGTLFFTMAMYALGGIADDGAAFLMGWTVDDATPDGTSITGMNAVWMALLAVLGMARWRLRYQWHRNLVDAVWGVCVLNNMVLVGTGNRSLGSACAALIVGFSIVLGQRVWKVSRGAALTLIPLCLLLAYEAASLF